MKVTVIRTFIDKYTGERCEPGQILDVTPKRMAELASKDVIAKIVVPDEPEVPEVKEVIETPEKKAPAKKAPAKKRTTTKKG